MLTGDFNTILSRSLDRRRSDPFDASRVFSCALNRLLDACCSVGFWRYLQPTSSSYTWTRSNGSLSSRIDFIWDSLSKMCGSRLCLLVTLLRAPSPVIALLLCRFTFLNFLLLFQEFGSLIHICYGRLRLWFLISGPTGVICNLVFPPWLSGGTKGKASLKGSLLYIVAIVLLGGRSTVTSCLGWQTTLNVVKMPVSRATFNFLKVHDQSQTIVIRVEIRLNIRRNNNNNNNDNKSSFI